MPAFVMEEHIVKYAPACRLCLDWAPPPVDDRRTAETICYDHDDAEHPDWA